MFPSRPCTYLGLSGMKRIPVPKTQRPDDAYSRLTTMRHEPDPGALRAAMETQSGNRDQ